MNRDVKILNKISSWCGGYESPILVETAHLDKMHHLFKTGILNKHSFISAMYHYHQILFQYSDRLRNNIIESFTITAEGVEVRSREGARFACDPDDVYGIPLGAFSFGEVERTAGDLLIKFMPENGVFFDIGANVGWYSIHVARNNPQAKIWAFEPLPPTYKWLSKNIKLNELSNITAINTGLAEKEGELTFYFRPDMTGAASARNITEASDAREYSCPIRKLDDCWREIGSDPSLIKCDVEGAELLVFQGGHECLAKSKPVIFCEMLRKWSAKFNYTPNDIIQFLSDLGYDCFEPAPNALKKFERMTEETTETNFFFLHREKHQEFFHSHVI